MSTTLETRIRQLVLVAENLDQVTRELMDVFGLRICYRDPGVEHFGLVNALLPVGDTFLEVVSPKEEGTTAGRLLEKRKGDGGYMAILQVDHFAEINSRIDELKLRKIWSTSNEQVDAAHLHPKDLGNTCILSIDEMRPPESWLWAGSEWEQHIQTHLVSTLLGVELSSEEPEQTAKIWGDLLMRPYAPDGDGWHIALANDTWIRFVAAGKQRPPGLEAISLRCSEPMAVLSRAREQKLTVTSNSLTLGGVRFDLIA